jgi:Protein of unknown function (DUF5818)
MRRGVLVVLLALATSGLAASAAGAAVFTGNIGDSMCGLKHEMPGGAKKCTLDCIKEGAKYILADPVHGKVYKLSDQKAASRYPGQDVVVEGTLKGDTIMVSSIKPRK